jgi:hypothetical protein
VPAQAPVADLPVAPEVAAEPLLSAVPPLPDAAAAEAPAAWTSYAPSGSVLPGDSPHWS